MSGRGAASTVEVALAWAASSSVPRDDAWLTRSERRVLSGLRVAKRVADWRLGRWVAKEAIRRCLDAPRLPGSELEVLAADSGAPVVAVAASGSSPGVVLSLSHAGGWGFAAAASSPLRLGCDVEVVEPRSEAFVDDYLTPTEARWVRAGGTVRPLRSNLIWSAKESALKALGEGLRMDTRAVEVAAGEPSHGWARLEVRAPGPVVLTGWWRAGAGCVWTVAADGPVNLRRIPPD